MQNKAFFYLLLLFSLRGNASCPQCLHYIQVLDQLVSPVQASYGLMLQGPEQGGELAEDQQLPTLTETIRNVNEDLDAILKVMEISSLFSLSSILPCKLKQTHLFDTKSSLLQMWETFARHLTEGIFSLTSKLNLSDEKPSGTVSEALRRLLPVEGFEFRVASAFQSLATNYPSTTSRIWLSSWGLLSSQMAFRCHAFATLEADLGQHPEKCLCRSCWDDEERATLPDLFTTWSGIFQSLQKSAYLALERLQCQQTAGAIPNLLETIQHCTQQPLLSSEGYPVGFIAEDPSQTFFIQKEGSFYYATLKRVWDPEVKKHRPTTVWELLTLDSSTGLVSSPAAFRGLPAPRLAFIKWDDYVAAVQGHLDNTESFLRRLCFEAGETYENWSTVKQPEDENP